VDPAADRSQVEIGIGDIGASRLFPSPYPELFLLLGFLLAKFVTSAVVIRFRVRFSVSHHGVLLVRG
jgi:hypothetical protein